MSSAPPEDVLVRVENLGKIFCRDFKKSLWYGLRDSGRDLVSFGRSKKPAGSDRTLRPGEFWANRGVSFELRRGECLGLIGHNGAGKTTLLKMLNGLIKPDTGRVEMRGRVGALIALGAGFNPLLTGRENIYVNAAMLGLTKKEIDERVDEIIDYAEIREFIDAPVQTYSSGMQVRLGFAVATALKPDVLILDEVLAVGDFSFRQKCLRRVSQMIKECAVIFVSHNFEQLERICTRGLVLNRGQSVGDGTIQEAREIYDRLIEGAEASLWAQEGVEVLGPPKAERFVATEGGFKVRLRLKTLTALPDFACRLRFQNKLGEYIAGYHSLNHGVSFRLPAGEHDIELDIPAPPLKRDRYGVDLFLNGCENDLLKIVEMKRFAELEVRDRSYGFDSVQI